MLVWASGTSLVSLFFTWFQRTAAPAVGWPRSQVFWRCRSSRCMSAGGDWASPLAAASPDGAPRSGLSAPSSPFPDVPIPGQRHSISTYYWKKNTSQRTILRLMSWYWNLRTKTNLTTNMNKWFEIMKNDFVLLFSVQCWIMNSPFEGSQSVPSFCFGIVLQQLCFSLVFVSSFLHLHPSANTKYH